MSVSPSEKFCPATSSRAMLPPDSKTPVGSTALVKIQMVTHMKSPLRLTKSGPIQVAASLNDEDCDAIDAGLLMGPDGRLWCTYGTYFGFIRVIELDPATGARMEGCRDIDIAIDCEATDLIYRNGCGKVIRKALGEAGAQAVYVP